MVPAEDQEIALPCASEIVIIVLLKVEFTWATPAVMFLETFLRVVVRLSRAMLPSLLLLAGDRLGRTLAGAGIRVGPLTAHRQAAPVAQAAITAQIHQPLDVHGLGPAEVALHGKVRVDVLANRQHLGVGQLVDAPFLGDTYGVADLLCRAVTDAVNVGQ